MEKLETALDICKNEIESTKSVIEQLGFKLLDRMSSGTFGDLVKKCWEFGLPDSNLVVEHGMSKQEFGGLLADLSMVQCGLGIAAFLMI